MNWKGAAVLVTGGASFIGSHLVDALVQLGAWVRVVDNLSSGKRENIVEHIRNGRVDMHVGDLFDEHTRQNALRDVSIVFHLAADHGGRGYVDLHQGACSRNLALDGMLFRDALKAQVYKVVYASSGCIYPNYLQGDPQRLVYLSEEQAGRPYDADGMYGWAKLMGELTLRAYHHDFGMRSACCRYFTVYGERGHENHAVLAMCARAAVKQDPFVVWGNGEQIRNWTHVSDIVAGTLLAAERIEDGSAVNLGTMERVRVLDAVREVIRLADYAPEIELQTDMPTGPMNRVCDNRLARELLGWEPQVRFRDGLRMTYEWYCKTKSADAVRAALETRLTER